MCSYKTTVQVDGFGALGVHFVHQPSSKEGSVPLLFVHGWPGSYLEVAKILPMLTEGGDGPWFHVVAPSLPNFGFSDGVADRAFSIPHYAQAMHKVMLALGYHEYVTQGGDWGSMITRRMAIQYPSHCLASHLNFVPVPKPTESTSPLNLVASLGNYTPAERLGMERSEWFRREGYGYNMEQGTKPHTLGFALSDSPIALLAWIYEKLHDWTDAYPWTDDEILVWVSLYVFSTAGPAASVRIYYENMHHQAPLWDSAPGVLVGYSIFPMDVVVPPTAWARAALGKAIVFEARHSHGGHFAAWERPEKLVGDLKTMFGPGGGAESVTRRFALAKAKM
ncbi:hypothetical protein CDD82_1221 [Ophiocordyceps australis]|uniref:AB hydrolase-1 domain-containing protein n=1 Tax=Ophiocordyceps australis TaxID=1399860 RepID=A0A2C5YKZ6_9HYPO|nr:hypothetical protein CDD82_1221 [Ophiocordyceps australis]